MKVIAVLLIFLGVVGVALGMMMFGDISIACIVGGLSALLSCVGFLTMAKKLQ